MAHGSRMAGGPAGAPAPPLPPTPRPGPQRSFSHEALTINDRLINEAFDYILKGVMSFKIQCFKILKFQKTKIQDSGNTQQH